MLSRFVGGLKPYLGREVRLDKPETLLDALDIAKEYEAHSEDIHLEKSISSRIP